MHVDFRQVANASIDGVLAFVFLKNEGLVKQKLIYDTVSDVVECKVHQCQQNSDA